MAVAAMAALAGCTPTTEQPADPVSVTPTDKAVVGVQTGAPPAPGTDRAPAPTPTVLPDGTINRGGGRPDTNDNGSWEMSVAPPTMPTTYGCAPQYPCW